MSNFFLDTGITLSNRAWKLTGKKPSRPVGLRIELPDRDISRMAEATLKEINERAAFPFGNRLRTRWIQSSRDASAASSTETAFASMLIRHWDPELAWEAIKVFFLNRSLEGRMPLDINPLTVSPYPAYPFILLALCRFHDSTADSARTRELFRKYLKYSDWLVIYHKAEGGLYTHSDEEWFRYDFLAKPLQTAVPSAASHWRDVASVGLNSVIAYQYRLLSKAAFAAGEQRDGRKLDNHARKIAALLNEKFWDEDGGFYMDLLGNEKAGRPAVTGLLPLAAEAPIRSQAERIVQRLPEFRSELLQGLASKHYNGVFLYMIADGLMRYGHGEQCGSLAHAFAADAAKLNPSAETLFQRIIAVNSIIDHLIGYHSFGERFVLFPRLPVEWRGQMCAIEDSMRGLRIEFMLGEDQDVQYTVSRHRGETARLTVKNNSFKNVAEGTGDAENPAPRVEPPEQEVAE